MPKTLIAPFRIKSMAGSIRGVRILCQSKRLRHFSGECGWLEPGA